LKDFFGVLEDTNLLLEGFFGLNISHLCCLYKILKYI
jgi:hypothetical protein